jgi:hypothetical protein
MEAGEPLVGEVEIAIGRKEQVVASFEGCESGANKVRGSVSV